MTTSPPSSVLKTPIFSLSRSPLQGDNLETKERSNVKSGRKPEISPSVKETLVLNLEEEFSFLMSPPRPKKRARDSASTHMTKRFRGTQRRMPKVALELIHETLQVSEFFRCYAEDDIVDKPELRGLVRDSPEDEDCESEEELVNQVLPEMLKVLEQAVMEEVDCRV